MCALDFNKGLRAAQSGDYATALKEWTVLAEQGDAEAQNRETRGRSTNLV